VGPHQGERTLWVALVEERRRCPPPFQTPLSLRARSFGFIWDVEAVQAPRPHRAEAKAEWARTPRARRRTRVVVEPEERPRPHQPERTQRVAAAARVRCVSVLPPIAPAARWSRSPAAVEVRRRQSPLGHQRVRPPGASAVKALRPAPATEAPAAQTIPGTVLRRVRVAEVERAHPAPRAPAASAMVRPLCWESVASVRALRLASLAKATQPAAAAVAATSVAVAVQKVRRQRATAPPPVPAAGLRRPTGTVRTEAHRSPM